MKTENKKFWDRIFEKNTDIIYRQVAGEVILVPVAQKPDELGYIFNLNETSSRIWELIDGKRTVCKIKEILKGEFQVSEERLKKDVIELFEIFQKEALVK